MGKRLALRSRHMGCITRTRTQWRCAHLCIRCTMTARPSSRASKLESTIGRPAMCLESNQLQLAAAKITLQWNDLHLDEHTCFVCTGDTIASVNETTVDGFQHKDIVQLIRACGNTIRLETVYSDSIRKAELEARLQYLKQTLHEKWDEYRSLMMQEQRLVHGIVMSDAAVYESLESAGVYGSLGAPSPAALRALHCTGSTSSSASYLSTATEDDPLYQTCLYQADRNIESDGAEKNQQREEQLSQRPHRLRPASEFFTSAKTHLTRSASTRSYLRGSSSSSSTTAAGEKQGGFNSLQRKPKQKSFRRRLLKFIPGLNRPLEEEESKL
ncbi:general receptor for phosphoinositides 1-associated scaffold protein isoform X2 [Lampris incognitus]|uniref:general receptor for phosphoinositides 1-associated scaffold protein isoform X2 n=1 Tax=Lampris incognitus TaxID=2546036 RepID=UPI0024B4B70F|nr:general receptor for phosphoinositides 1-associated scaffold protein isoform X2 [Lampris incognitus]